VKVADSGNLAVTIGGSVAVQPHVSVTTAVLPAATTGRAFSTTLAVTGGTPSYQWLVLTGTLPAGLTLNTSTGAITGTPTSPTGSSGTPVTFRVTDTLGATGDRTLTLLVN
jgi:hypothetical protein